MRRLRPLALVAPVAAQFAIDGRLDSVGRYGNGHINETFAAAYARDGRIERYVFQRINRSIFADVPALMQNIGRVTRHVRAWMEEAGAGDIDRRALRLIQTGDGVDFLQDDDGAYWRAYAMVEGARTWDAPQSGEQAFAAASAFGEFARILSDLPGPALNETIPRFHDTPARLDALLEVVAVDPVERAASASAEIRFAERNGDLAWALQTACERSNVPERVAHNDTKINNVLIDDRTGEGLCVLDLDTVMRGQVLCDYGDLVRTAACRAAEDEPNPANVQIDADLFESVTRGYLRETGDLLLPDEVENFVTAAKVLTFECGMRFLADFVRGDRYFRVLHPRQNLDRARAQFALVASIGRDEDDLRRRVCAALALQ